MKSKSFHNTEVVVVGAGINALGVMRSLGQEFCTALITQKNTLVSRTKYGTKFYVDTTTDKQIIEDLIAFGRLIAKPSVLLLTEEKTVELVSENRKKLEQYFLFDFPSHELLTDLQSKSQFQYLAEKYEAPIPKAVFWTAECSNALLDVLDFPCVFKPLRQDKAYSKQFKKAYKVESIEAVYALYKEIAPVMPDMIIQEWITGEDSDIYFNIIYFDKLSNPVIGFTGRKLRSWPRGIGGTASCVDAPEAHAELTRYTSKFAKDTGFTGLMGMEYKFDTKRQAFYMIEPTVGRTDYQHEIATLSGTNILTVICSHLLGRKTENKQRNSDKTSTIWYDEIADANSLAHGSPTFDNLDVVKHGAVFRWYDLGPYIFRLKERIKSKIIGYK
ncbi:carboxylate--amine ligase [Thalassotalea fusca]